jgi:hypothetical protein
VHPVFSVRGAAHVVHRGFVDFCGANAFCSVCYSRFSALSNASNKDTHDFNVWFKHFKEDLHHY